MTFFVFACINEADPINSIATKKTNAYRFILLYIFINIPPYTYDFIKHNQNSAYIYIITYIVQKVT